MQRQIESGRKLSSRTHKSTQIRRKREVEIEEEAKSEKVTQSKSGFRKSFEGASQAFFLLLCISTCGGQAAALCQQIVVIKSLLVTCLTLYTWLEYEHEETFNATMGERQFQEHLVRARFVWWWHCPVWECRFSLFVPGKKVSRFIPNQGKEHFCSIFRLRTFLSHR